MDQPDGPVDAPLHAGLGRVGHMVRVGAFDVCVGEGRVEDA